MQTVIVACVHNAGRSQMAAAFFNQMANPALARAISAGTRPAACVHPEVVEAMRDVGIDLAEAKPRLLTPELAADAQLLVTTGCGDECPLVPGLRRALAETRGRLVVVLNLEAQVGETTGFGPADHLAALFEHAPDLTVHAVLVDSSALADDHARLEKDVADRGARLVVADVAVTGEPRHDPDRLAEAFRRIVDEA